MLAKHEAAGSIPVIRSTAPIVRGRLDIASHRGVDDRHEKGSFHSGFVQSAGQRSLEP